MLLYKLLMKLNKYLQLQLLEKVKINQLINNIPYIRYYYYLKINMIIKKKKNNIYKAECSLFLLTILSRFFVLVKRILVLLIT